MAAEALGVREKGMDDRAAAGAAVEEMGAFLRLIGHPLRLSEAGAKDDDLVKAASLSLSDGAIVNNPRLVLDEGEVLAIYRAAF